MPQHNKSRIYSISCKNCDKSPHLTDQEEFGHPYERAHYKHKVNKSAVAAHVWEHSHMIQEAKLFKHIQNLSKLNVLKKTIYIKVQIKGKESENSYQELKRSQKGQAHTNTRKLNRDISTGTAVFVNWKRVNVCENMQRWRH